MIKLPTKLLALAPAGLLMVAGNYAIDPENLFHEGCEAPAAEALVAGQAVDATKLDYRLLQKRLVEKMDGPRDVIVLGSSRGMQIRSAQFPGLRFFNHSVPAARLEDLLATYQTYVEKRTQPRSIILVLDPWTLSPIGTSAWMRPAANYLVMCRRLGIAPRASAAGTWGFEYAELISPAYFRSSVRRWIDNGGRLRTGCGAQYDQSVVTSRGFIQPDGSFDFPPSASARDLGEIRRMTLRLKRYTVANQTAPGELDADVKAEFDAFIRFLLRAEIQVVFVLPPIHPEALEILRQTHWGPRIEAGERFMNSLAARHNLPVVGSFDPSASGCDSSQFFDAIHPADSCVAHILGSWAAAVSAKLVKQGPQPRSMF